MFNFKIIIILTNYSRYQFLPNCLRYYISKNIFLISIKNKFLFKILKKIFKKKIIFISCDKLLNENNFYDYNLWFNSELELYLDNKPINNKDLFVYKNPFFENEHIPVFPTRIVTHEVKKKSIVYFSEANIETSEEARQFWHKNKDYFLNNFHKINYIEFSNIQLPDYHQKNLPEYLKKLSFIKELKRFFRFEIVNLIHENYNKDFILVGTSWQKYGIRSLKSNYSIKKKKELIKNNVCIDLGSQVGTMEMDFRTVDIIENGGILLQAKQKNSQELLEKYDYLNKFICNSKIELLDKLNFLIKSKECFTNQFKIISSYHKKKFEEKILNLKN